MGNDITILHFLSAFAAVNGIFLALFLAYFNRFKNVANYYLALLILLFSVRAGVAIMVCYHDSADWLYLQLGITVCFFLGPLLYFYIATLFQQDKKKPKHWGTQLITLFVLATVLGVFYPVKKYNPLWKTYLVYLPFIIWLAYSIKATRLAWLFIQDRSNHSDLKGWLRIIIIGNFALWGINMIERFTSYTLVSFSIACWIYLLLFYLIFVTHKSNLFSLKRIKAQITYAPESDNNKEILAKLHELISEQELFKDPSLKSSQVAQLIEIPNHKLSELINQTHDTNFSNYINQYRIEYAKRLLKERQNYTIEAIGQECGFNSKSSFYAAFKRETGTTPSKFVQN